MKAEIATAVEPDITLTMTGAEARALFHLCLSDITIPTALAGSDRNTREFVQVQGTVQSVSRALRPVLRGIR